MRRTARALAVCLLAWGALAAAARGADGRVVGRATDSAGAPVAGVVVSIPALGLFASTDAAGDYELAPVPPGTHTVAFSFDSGAIMATAEVADGQEVRVDAQSAGTESFAEVITVYAASRRAERITEAPAAISVIPAEEIERSASHGQLPLLLEHTPGAAVTQSGIYDFNFNTRGFNSSLNRRVAVLVDGREGSVPFLGSQEWAAVGFPLDDLQQAEVVRGPAAALYGANASSGILNLITKTPRGTEGGLVRLTGGELSTLNADLRWAGRLGEAWWGKAVGGLRQSGDFTVSRVGAAEYSIPCTATVTSDCLPQERVPLDPEDDDDIKFASARVDRYVAGDENLLTFEGGWADVSGPVFQTGIGRVQLVDVERRWARGNFSTPHWNFLGTTNAREAPRQTALSTGNNLALDEESWKFEVQTNWSFAEERFRVVAGASYRDDDIDSSDEGSRPRPRAFQGGGAKSTRQTLLFEPVHHDFAALFAQADWWVNERLKLVVAARYDDSSLHDAEISPKAALVWAIDEGSSLRLSYNRGFQVPNYSEFFLQAEVRPAINLGAVPCFERSLVTGQFVPCAASPIVNLEELCALDGVPCYFDTDFVPGEGAEFAPRPPGQITPDTQLLAAGYDELGLEEVETLELGYSGVLGDRAFLTVDVYRSENQNFITDLLPQLGTALGRVNPKFGPYQLPEGLSTARQDQINFILNTVLGPFRPFLTTNVDGVPVLVLASYSNFGSVDTQGVDVGLDWGLSDDWSLSLAGSWFDFEIQDSRPGLDRLLLPNTPELSGSAQIAYVADRFDASLGYRWSDDFRWVVGPFQGDVPSYGVVDASANFDLNAHFSIGLNVQNLLDDEHWESFGGDLLSRRALGSLTFRW